MGFIWSSRLELMQDWASSCLALSLFEADRDEEEEREVDEADEAAFRLYWLVLLVLG